MVNEILISVFTSGVVAAGVSGFFNLKTKKNEYIHDYYKQVLVRRVSAYEKVEILITMLKAAVVGDDGRPYHLLFSQNKDAEIYEVIFGSMSQALWLTDDLFSKIREVNTMVYNKGEEDAIEFGKTNYQTLAELRTDIERLHSRDMLVLYDIESFLKNKKPVNTFSVVNK